MTYWHMQLHPNDPGFKREKEILEQTNMIGLGEWLEGAAQMSQFEHEMTIGDIVLIRLGGRPIALVEITGEFEKVETVNHDLDWFPSRRKVKVVEFMEEQKNDFPSPRGTLKKSVNRYTPTYQYINDWYNQVIDPDSSRKGLKIRNICMDSYKIFQDININLLDKEDKSQAIIILAGINGSGKTTLLEYIANFDTTPTFDKKDHIDIDLNGESLTIYKDSKKKQTKGIRDFKSSVIYLPIDFGNIENLEQQIKSYIDELMFERDYKASEAYEELQNNIAEIFSDLDFNIEFSGLDKHKNIFFKNSNGEKIGINALSTGEKTLLTKVLYLYLSSIKDKVILIDEPEISLHPTWQNSVLKLYENFAHRNNNQIIIATHSPHILASAKNAYIRLLTIKDNKVEVIDNFSQSYGLEFSKVLTDIMGVEYLRTPEVEKTLNEIKQLILSGQFKTDRFQNLWRKMENDLGAEDLDLKFLTLEINRREKNVQNR